MPVIVISLKIAAMNIEGHMPIAIGLERGPQLPVYYSSRSSVLLKHLQDYMYVWLGKK